MTNTKAIGNIGEQIAAEYLIEKGYEIIERNAVYCDCEVDIIATCRLDAEGNVIICKKRKSIFEKLKSKLKHSVSSKEKGEEVIVFCEVKTRYSAEHGSAAEAVTKYKVGRYVTAAKAYCSKRKCVGKAVRFDIIEVGEDGVNHIENAFSTNDAKYRRN